MCIIINNHKYAFDIRCQYYKSNIFKHLTNKKIAKYLLHRKRSCLINMPGLNCDFNQMVGTGKDLGVWSSLAAPGRKRRYRRDLRNLL
ncbi:UNVERIFIED_CONTAM: hypothetical protein NCL1_15753 [Trichonephila clavipes]